jgi:hypothetical protein
MYVAKDSYSDNRKTHTVESCFRVEMRRGQGAVGSFDHAVRQDQGSRTSKL